MPIGTASLIHTIDDKIIIAHRNNKTATYRNKIALLGGMTSIKEDIINSQPNLFNTIKREIEEETLLNNVEYLDLSIRAVVKCHQPDAHCVIYTSALVKQKGEDFISQCDESESSKVEAIAVEQFEKFIKEAIKESRVVRHTELMADELIKWTEERSNTLIESRKKLSLMIKTNK